MVSFHGKVRYCGNFICLFVRQFIHSINRSKVQQVHVPRIICRRENIIQPKNNKFLERLRIFLKRIQDFCLLFEFMVSWSQKGNLKIIKISWRNLFWLEIHKKVARIRDFRHRHLYNTTKTEVQKCCSSATSFTISTRRYRCDGSVSSSSGLKIGKTQFFRTEY